MQDRRINDRRLDSWKEIGAFFGRDERTVKRWETSRGLPVHRVPGSGRATVYAFASELEDWLKGPGVSLTQAQPEPSFPEPSLAEPSLPEPSFVDEVLPSEVASAMETPVEELRPRPTANGQTPPTESEVAGPGESNGASALRADSVAAAPSESSPTPPKARRWILGVGSLLLVAVACSGILTVVYRGHWPSGWSIIHASKRAANPEALEFFLKGEYYLQKRTPESLNQAVDNYTQAIVRDPSYAEAYVGLADCYNLLREYTMMPSSEAYPRALAAAKQAIAIDDSLSGAHSALAFVSFYWLRDTATAEREFERAIELDPNSISAHHWYATFLMHLGRFQQALEEIDNAQRLDPSAASILADKGLILFYAGQPDAGISLLKQVEAAEPAYRSPPAYLAGIYLNTGNYEGFLQESARAAQLMHDDDGLSVAEAGEQGLKAGGKEGMLRAILSRQLELYAAGRSSAFAVADTYARLDEQQKALEYLRISCAAKGTDVAGLLISPSFIPLRGRSEYQELLRQVGLPSTSK